MIGLQLKKMTETQFAILCGGLYFNLQLKIIFQHRH